MRDIEYYVTKNTKVLYQLIKKELEHGAFQISVDCRIRNEDDLKKASIAHAIKRQAKLLAAREFKQAKIPTLKMIVPNESAMLSGVEVRKGIPIPVFMPDIVEDHEVLTGYVTSGIIEHFRQSKGKEKTDQEKEHDRYLESLLLGVYPEILEIGEMDRFVNLPAAYQEIYLDIVQKYKPENFEIWEKRINEESGKENDNLSGVYPSENESRLPELPGKD
jgi:hypothetical protein